MAFGLLASMHLSAQELGHQSEASKEYQEYVRLGLYCHTVGPL